MTVRIMTSLSPGGGVLYTPPLCSSCHGHSNDPSFVVPSFPLVIQRLVDLLLLTTPSSTEHQHLLTALHNATNAAINLITLSSSSITPSPSSPHSTFTPSPTPLAHSPPHLTIRILTPLTPLPSPLSSSSTVSLLSGAKKTPCVQQNSASSAGLFPPIAPQLNAAGKGKKTWAAHLSSLTSSSTSPSSPSPSPITPPVSPSSSATPPRAVSDSEMVESPCAQPNSVSSAAVSPSSPETNMQDIEEKRDCDEEAKPSHDAILPSTPSSPSISSSITSSLLSSTASMMTSSCRQPETSVSYAAVNSLLTTQQEGGETVGRESGKEEEAVAKDADETTAHTTTVPPPHLTSPCNTVTDPIPLSPFCITVTTSEPKPSHQFSPGSIGASCGGVAGTKRKSKQGGGSKQKRSRKMMP